MKILAIVNQKGGVGKTTTAVTLAHALSEMGRRVLLVDLDAQGNCADALGMTKEGGLYALLFGSATRARVATGRKWLELVPSDKSTVEVKQRLAGLAFREYKLQQVLDPLKSMYDLVVLDVAPGVDVLQIGALVACTHFMIPVSLAHLAVVGAGDALASTASLKQVGAYRGTFLGILPTMWERTTKESHAQLEILAKQFGHLVWPPVPRDTKAREAPGFGKTLWEYAPQCRALCGVKVYKSQIGGYRAVVGRLMAEMGL